MILDQFKLDGKTALVTGASAGLGAAIAVALAQAGADVVCHGNTRPAGETCKRVKQLGRRAAAVQADLGSPQGAIELFEQAQRFAPIDVVINNAGTIRRAPAVEYSDEDWTSVLQVNLNNVFKLNQLAARSFISRKQPGKIVNIASLLSFQNSITVPTYAASKDTVTQLTKTLANE